MRKWTMFDDMDEWHAFVIGFSCALWFWKKLPMPLEYHNPLVKEYHYYVAGGGTAIALLVAAIICTIIKVTGG